MDGRVRPKDRRPSCVGMALGALCACFLLLDGCAETTRRSGPERFARSRATAARSVAPAPAPAPVRPIELAEPVELRDPAELPGLALAPEQESVRPAPAPSPRPSRAAAANPDDPQGLLKLLALNADQRRQESRRLVTAAREDRFNLDSLKAEEKLEVALRLDPENQEAAALLAQIRNEMGDRRGEIHRIHADMRQEVEAARQQLLSEIQILFAQGQRHNDAGEYYEATRDYEKAIELIRYNALNLDLSQELSIARQQLEKSKRLKAEGDEAERKRQEAEIQQAKEAEIAESLQYLKNRIKELRQKAQEAFERQDYDLAMQNAKLILEAYPEDRAAAELLRVANDNKHIQTRQKIFVDSVLNHRLALIGVQESAVLYHEIFRFPDRAEWERLAPKVDTLEELIAESETSVEKEIRRKLQEPQDISFPADTPFLEAIRSLRQLSGLNIILNKDANDAVEGENLTIELARVRDLPLERVLNLILMQAEGQNFGYSIQEGAIVIGPRDSLAKALFLHFYDIFDITQKHPDFPAPPLALDSLQGKDTTGGGFGGDAGLAEEEEDTGTVNIDKIEELVRNEITVNDEEVGTVNSQGGKLAVRTTLDLHKKVNRLLEELRKTTGVMVTVESRFLSLQDNYLEEIGIDMGSGSTTFLPNSIPSIDGAGNSIAPGYRFTNAQQDFNLRAASVGAFSNPTGSRINPFNITADGGGAYQLNNLTDQYQLEAILTGVAKDQEIRRLSSPRVTAFNTQIAHTLVINQAAYIRDLEVNQTGVVPVVNPKIGVLNTGSILEVRPNVSFDRKYVVLEIQPTLAESLDSEVAVLNLAGNFTVVPVELPVTSVTTIKTTVTIPDGGTVLVGGLKREIRTKSSVGIPGVRHIPVLNLLFGRKGESILRANLFVLLNSKITIVQEEEEKLFNI